MGFKKAIAAAKATQQIFSADIPDGQGGYFAAFFRLLNGEEAAWTFRIDANMETESSYEIIHNLRSFCASLIKFVETGEDVQETLQLNDILNIIYEEGVLNDPLVVLHPEIEDATLRLMYRGYLQQIQKVTNEEDFQKLNIKIKEFVWDLLYKGFRTSFDSDYLLALTTRYVLAYRKVVPNVIEDEIVSTFKRMLDEKRKQDEEGSAKTNTD